MYRKNILVVIARKIVRYRNLENQALLQIDNWSETKDQMQMEIGSTCAFADHSVAASWQIMYSRFIHFIEHNKSIHKFDVPEKHLKITDTLLPVEEEAATVRRWTDRRWEVTASADGVIC